MNQRIPLSGWDARLLREHLESPYGESRNTQTRRRQRRLVRKGLLVLDAGLYRVTDAGLEALKANVERRSL